MFTKHMEFKNHVWSPKEVVDREEIKLQGTSVPRRPSEADGSVKCLVVEVGESLEMLPLFYSIYH